MVQYIEVVTRDVDATCALYERFFNISFGREDATLGQARTAQRADGSMIGVRKPLAAHEQPILRTYLRVNDIYEAVEIARAGGATVAYPPTTQGVHGTFAIVIQDDVQHGLWQK